MQLLNMRDYKLTYLMQLTLYKINDKQIIQAQEEGDLQTTSHQDSL